MKVLKNDTAILLFSRLPREEAAVKRYGGQLGKQAGLKLATRMVRTTLHTAYASGYPVFPVFSDQQRGQSFGERLVNSIEEVLGKGYEKVIVIGSDCPTLSAAVIRRAEQKLRSDTLVAGPCPDGGVYLIGVHQHSYCRKVFLEISWGSPSVYRDLQQAATCSNLNLIPEESQDDIDSISDLISWYHNHKGHALFSLITHLLSSLLQAWNRTCLRLLIPFNMYTARPFRGPPVLLIL